MFGKRSKTTHIDNSFEFKNFQRGQGSYSLKIFFENEEICTCNQDEIPVEFWKDFYGIKLVDETRTTRARRKTGPVCSDATITESTNSLRLAIASNDKDTFMKNFEELKRKYQNSTVTQSITKTSEQPLAPTTYNVGGNIDTPLTVAESTTMPRDDQKTPQGPQNLPQPVVDSGENNTQPDNKNCTSSFLESTIKPTDNQRTPPGSKNILNPQPVGDSVGNNTQPDNKNYTYFEIAKNLLLSLMGIIAGIIITICTLGLYWKKEENRDSYNKRFFSNMCIRDEQQNILPKKL